MVLPVAFCSLSVVVWGLEVGKIVAQNKAKGS